MNRRFATGLQWDMYASKEEQLDTKIDTYSETNIYHSLRMYILKVRRWAKAWFILRTIVKSLPDDCRYHKSFGCNANRTGISIRHDTLQ